MELHLATGKTHNGCKFLVYETNFTNLVLTYFQLRGPECTSEVKEAYVSFSTRNQKTAPPNHEYALKSLANQKYLNVWELKQVSLL